MHKKDIIFAIICGLLVAWLAVDFFGIYGLICFFVLPILSIAGLWFSEWLGKKIPFIYQAGKFFLVGAFADVIDIKVFQLLLALSVVEGFFIPNFSLVIKSISFLVATFVKFWWNKHWAFEQHENIGSKKEIAQFFMVTLVGLGINVVSFYYISRMKTTLPTHTWTELSIILSALVSAIWNFAGYKFLVFKK